VKVALEFGPAEVCSLMLVGLLAGSTLAKGSPLKGIAMTVLGLLVGWAHLAENADYRGATRADLRRRGDHHVQALVRVRVQMRKFAADHEGLRRAFAGAVRKAQRLSAGDGDSARLPHHMR